MKIMVYRTRFERQGSCVFVFDRHFSRSVVISQPRATNSFIIKKNKKRSFRGTYDKKISNRFPLHFSTPFSSNALEARVATDFFVDRSYVYIILHNTTKTLEGPSMCLTKQKNVSPRVAMVTNVVRGSIKRIGPS